MKNKVLGTPPPTWSDSLFPLFMEAIREISSKSKDELLEMCLWELNLFREQDRKEGKPERDYHPDSKWWAGLDFTPLYQDIFMYGPLVAALPSQTAA